MNQWPGQTTLYENRPAAAKATGSLLYKHHLAIAVLLCMGYIITKQMKMEIPSIGFFCLIALLVLRCNINRVTYLFFFLSPMYLFITAGSFPVYDLVVGMLVLHRILQKKIRNAVVPIFAVCLLLILELVGMLVSGSFLTLNLVKLFVILLIAVLQIYDPPADYDNTTAIKYLLWGTFIFAGMYILFNYNIMINPSNRTGGLGDLDPNTYAMYNLFAAAIALQQIFLGKTDKKETLLYIAFIAVYIIGGFMTLSKTFAILLTIMVLLCLILNFRSKKNLLLVAVVAGTFIIFLNIPFFKGVLNELILRFTSALNLNELTTGRAEIMAEYAAALQKNPQVLVFGGGMQSYMGALGIPYRPHNTVLELVSAWGVAGGFIFLYMFIRGAKTFGNAVQKKRIYAVNAVPMIILLLFFQTLTLLYQEATYAYIIMAVMVLYMEPGREVKQPQETRLVQRGVYRK